MLDPTTKRRIVDAEAGGINFNMLGIATRMLAGIAHEFTMFAAVAFLIGGASDVIVDLIWIIRGLRRRLFVFRRYARTNVTTLGAPANPGRIAIFVPAWDESAVIGSMLRHAVMTVSGADWVIYVGVYPNDPATRAAVASVDDPRIRIVEGTATGPSTKAACLNTLWARLMIDETHDGQRVKAVVLHDAEDVVHADEARVFDTLIERFDLVQLPVLPLVDRRSRWVSGHYIDEFATHHSRTMLAREAIGASLPSAGVGCAFSRAILGRVAEGRDGPFDATSLTEDYELGLRIRKVGGRCAFVRLPAYDGGPFVAVRAHFPATIEGAFVQKSRWVAGIALSGWDRLGWEGGIAERWMRINDRRAVFAALVLLAAYVALLLDAVTIALDWLFGMTSTMPISPMFASLLLVCGGLLAWRLAIRAALVTRLYGWREGVRSIPRAFVANVIDMIAARRAVALYRRARRDGVVRWDKTRHEFPADPATAR